MFSLGHLSDLHATAVRPRARELLNKRFLGWLSWRVKRSRIHRPEVLEALLEDLRAEAPDHVAVTGDLTNLGLESELAEARGWLERLGSARSVSVVPGNHDTYVARRREAGWGRHWPEFVASDPEANGGSGLAFPTLRVRGPLALVGLSTAVPTPPFFATGRVGEAQLERLEALLGELRDGPLCRVLLLHHPPTAGLARRRELRDAEALRALLRRCGAELVLHGHAHRTRIGELPGPEAPIPVVGVRSSSDAGSEAEKAAQYHLYDVAPAGGAGGRRFEVRLRIRGFDPASGRFAAVGERDLLRTG